MFSLGEPSLVLRNITISDLLRNAFDQWVIGVWQGTYGTNALFWPTFLFGGTEQSAYNLSVGPPPSLICSETLSIL